MTITEYRTHYHKKYFFFVKIVSWKKDPVRNLTQIFWLLVKKRKNQNQWKTLSFKELLRSTVKLPHRYMSSFRFLKYSSNCEIEGKIYEFKELEIWVVLYNYRKKIRSCYMLIKFILRWLEGRGHFLDLPYLLKKKSSCKRWKTMLKFKS